MIALPASVRVWLALGQTDMRRYAARRIMRSPRRGEPPSASLGIILRTAMLLQHGDELYLAA